MMEKQIGLKIKCLQINEETFFQIIWSMEHQKEFKGRWNVSSSQTLASWSCGEGSGEDSKLNGTKPD